MKKGRRIAGVATLFLAGPGIAAAQGDRTLTSTYVGGEAGDVVNALAVGDDGSIYLAGETSSTSFPASEQTTFVGASTRGPADAFVAKLARGADEFEWVVVLGGSDLDSAEAVAVDGDDVFVSGYTLSDDFPTESPALDAPEDACNGDSLCGSDGWLAAVSPGGDGVDFSTYVGGSRMDQVTDMAARAGVLFVTGRTTSKGLPQTNGWRGKPSGGIDDFVLRFSPRARQFTHGTYLGSSDDEGWPSLDLARRDVIVGTTTAAARYPAGDTFRVGPRGDGDGVLLRLGRTLRHVRSSVQVGGRGGDAIWDVAAGPRGRVTFVGTTSSEDFPTRRPFQPEREGDSDAFVATVDLRRRRLRHSTFIGGGEYDVAWAVARSGHRVVVAGETPSSDFPTRRAAQAEPPSTECTVEDVHCTDGFVATFGRRGSLESSTYVAGSRFDSAYAVSVAGGEVLLAGLTHSPDFPEASSPQPVLGGPYDGFLAMLAL